MNHIISKCTDLKHRVKRNNSIFEVLLLAFLPSGSFYVLYSQLLTIKRESRWFDEAISFLTAKLPLPQILNNSIQDPHPPFYYLLLHGWFKLASSGDVNGRFLSLLLNIATTPLLYLLANLLLQNKKQALFTAFLFSISPFHILYSHELRMYTLLIFLSTIVILTYLKARQTGQNRYWFLFGATAVLTMYTHLFTAFVLLAIGTHTLANWRDKNNLYKTIAVGLIILVLFSPWLYMLAQESQSDIGSLRPLQTDSELFNPIKPITSIAFLLFGQASTIWYAGTVFFLVLATTIVFVMDLLKARKQGEDISFLQLPILLILLSIGIPNLVYFINPFFLPERTMAAAAPFILILLAWGMARKHSPLPYLVGATAVTMFIGTIIYLTTDNLVKPPYRDMIQFVAEQQQQGDVIVHTSDGSYIPSLSYVNLPGHILLDGDPDMRKPNGVYQALGGEIEGQEKIKAIADRLWLIVVLEHSVEWQQEQVDYFNEQYALLETHDFNGISVYLYETTPNEP